MTLRHASIANSLDALGPKLSKRLALLGAAEVAVVIAAFILASLALDWLLELPLAARLVLLGACAGIVAFVLHRGRKRLAQRFEKVDFAAAVEGADPSLDGHLLGALELPSEHQSLAKGDVDPDSPGRALERNLLERAIEESSRNAARATVATALSPIPLLERGGLALAGVAIVLVLASGMPATFGLWLRRNVLLSSETWPRKTHFVLDRTESIWHHARKDPLEIGAWVTGEIPRQVRLQLAGQTASREVLLVPGAFGKLPSPAEKDSARDDSAAPDEGESVPAALEGRRLLHTLPSVTEDLTIQLEGGDNVSSLAQVKVHDRPRILSTKLTLRFPAYLALPEKSLENPGGDTTVPAGTEISVEAEADLDLSAAWLRFGPGDKKPAVVEGKIARASVTPAENGFLDVGATDATWGLESDPPLRFAIVVLPDRSPSITLEIDGESRALTARGKLTYRVQAEDDHGISDLSLKTWIRAPSDSRPEEEIEPAVTRLSGALEKLPAGVRSKAEGELDLAPLQLATGSSITIQAWVSDNDGIAGPKSASSQKETITIVDPEELRKELDKVRLEAQAALEQLAAREETVAKSIEEATEARAAAKSSPSTPSKATKPAKPAKAGKTSKSSNSQASESSEAEPLDPAEESAEPSESAASKSAKTASARASSAKSKSSPAARPSPSEASPKPESAETAESKESEPQSDPAEEPQSPGEKTAKGDPKSKASKAASPRPGTPPSKQQAAQQAAGKSQTAEPSEASPEEPAASQEAETPESQLAKEQQQLSKEAAEVSRRVREMTRALRQNGLLEPAEERRMRDEVSKPLDEIAEEKLPESASEIGALPESENLPEKAAAAQRKAEKISDEVKKVADKLAGAGSFREILQRLELIIELQKKTIGETEKRLPAEAPVGKPVDANNGKERSF